MTVTLYVPAATALTDRIEVPELVTLAGARLASRPGELTISRATVPLKPLRPVTVSLAVPPSPASRTMLEGLAVTVKSTTATVIRGVLWESEPILAVTVTL